MKFVSFRTTIQLIIRSNIIIGVSALSSSERDGNRIPEKILRTAERIGGFMELVKYENRLYLEIKKLIDNSRNKVASIVNSEITDLYWNWKSY